MRIVKVGGGKDGPTHRKWKSCPVALGLDEVHLSHLVLELTFIGTDCRKQQGA